MDAERQRRLFAIFDEALLQEPSARQAFIERACAEDRELGSEVLHLLIAHHEMGSFLEHPTELSAPRSEPDLTLGGPPSNQTHFPGTGRFRVLRRLGAGGMGVVYEVHDQVRDEVVALKTLARTSAADVYRLKREFRGLADVSHPNLVCLYELFVDDQLCFFTMELVRGMNFVDYARGPDRTVDRDRLLPAFRQLIEGVSALHRKGKLHRDIKPSNLLVTAEGRVVILDFGVIAELQDHAAGIRYVRGGTPAYMSPEEGSGATPSAASDWYGVGVTLYEALTGRLPFDGPPFDVLRRKRADDPPAPADIVQDLPAPLSTICMALLARDPKQRRTGSEALRELDGGAPVSVSESGPAGSRDAPFVGRDRQLQLLNDAFNALSRGAGAVVSVHGASGIGKSALIGRFLSQFGARDDVVVLFGRCYENETVPYKALDGVVDDLSRYLGSLTPEDVQPLIPRDAPALTRVFPVLLQVKAIAKVCAGPEPGSVDPTGLRRHAFDALRVLIGRVADRRKLVVWIDDLQWADADGVLLLEELLRPPSQPTMLTVLCFRSEETMAKPFLQSLLDRAGRHGWSSIALDPMTDKEADTLIRRLVSTDSPPAPDAVRLMTREAGGSPFVLEQLARHADGMGSRFREAPTFAAIFNAQLDALSLNARRFLEALAICARPMSPELLCQACGVVREKQSLIATLRSLRLIRSSGSSEQVETYHDRIREVIASQIPGDAMSQIHRHMVNTLVERRSDDCEALFEHYRGAGDPENASTQAGLAAAKANAALAFDRAAFFYRQALTLMPAASAAAAWREWFSDALAHAGRPAEAAEAYLIAAQGAPHAARVDLQRRAAEQFLIGGHIDRGLELMRTVLASVGLRVAGGPRRTVASLLARRLRQRWRGWEFTTRNADQVDPDALLRVDTCWSATTGLALVDLLTASDFSARHVSMALELGEPSRVARALALESVARAAFPSGRAFAAHLIEQAKSMAQALGNPQAMAVTILAEGINATTSGQWKNAWGASEEALTILRDQCVGLTWESNMAQNLVIWALMYLGELAEVSRRVPALLADARSRGNLYLAAELCTRSNYAWLAVDKADEGERETIAAMAGWSHKGFHRQHYSAMLARTQTALYRGDGEAAWRLLGEQESSLRQSLMTHVQLIRIEAFYLRARAALALAPRKRNTRELLAVARKGAKGIARERMPWSDPIALLLQASIAYLEGNSRLALRCLHAAAAQFERADMKLYVAVTKTRIAALQSDAEGPAFRRQASEWFAAQNVKNPMAMTRMLSPGFPDSS